MLLQLLYTHRDSDSSRGIFEATRNTARRVMQCTASKLALGIGSTQTPLGATPEVKQEE